ncbi:hypothetical protein HMPREF0322_04486 [Desulfitobacterium hafniense DP7]|uniref:Uncharacterized protein n=1 Tax=Desulfitobacterium hafniense DP7 TaxID=537010 RepID=G9XU28_DESHA|nr:hypothetical protein HMPREF0322_04486 [Desulfitobacterium hafniense DP7]
MTYNSFSWAKFVAEPRKSRLISCRFTHIASPCLDGKIRV